MGNVESDGWRTIVVSAVLVSCLANASAADDRAYQPDHFCVGFRVSDMLTSPSEAGTASKCEEHV